MAPKKKNPISWRDAWKYASISGCDAKTMMALLRGNWTDKMTTRRRIVTAMKAKGLGHLIPPAVEKSL